MPQQTLDYRGPDPRPTAPNPGLGDYYRSATLAATVAIIVFMTNVVLVSIATADQSWGALGIMIIYGPITNGILCAVSFASTPLVKRVTGGALTLHILASLLPLLAIFVDALLIFSMDLHGC